MSHVERMWSSMLTKRDVKIIEFLEQYKIASTTILTHFFFPSEQTCRRRLKYLYDNHKIDRERDFVNNEYLYFLKKPRQLKHSLYVVKFYHMLHKNYTVESFEIEKKMADIRPDAVFTYKDKGMTITGLLEVELSNKGLNQSKYERFIVNRSYRDYFNNIPVVFAVTKQDVERGTNLQFIKIKLDLVEKY